MTASAKILGIDPGSRFCGYGLIASTGSGRISYRECGVLEPAQPARLEARLGELLRELLALVEELRPDALAVEGVFAGRNPRTAFSLGQARGVVLAVAGYHELPVFEYAPAKVKRAVAGNGRASKQQVSRMVRALCGLHSVPRADATDALAVAICHAFSSKAKRLLP